MCRRFREIQKIACQSCGFAMLAESLAFTLRSDAPRWEFPWRGNWSPWDKCQATGGVLIIEELEADKQQFLSHRGVVTVGAEGT